MAEILLLFLAVLLAGVGCAALVLLVLVTIDRWTARSSWTSGRVEWRD